MLLPERDSTACEVCATESTGQAAQQGSLAFLVGQLALVAAFVHALDVDIKDVVFSGHAGGAGGDRLAQVNDMQGVGQDGQADGDLHGDEYGTGFAAHQCRQDGRISMLNLIAVR
ncbi:hypothetical protein [Janthinobacterium agaricidamnosum]|uniref:hypothetical protein n=1 Tax=Janthinobacterium agaricidamnosum TaxID=55508 RepID=UPI001F09C7B9|nr:hypothetical protein [Janthinobacterium agaricidamnosum]